MIIDDIYLILCERHHSKSTVLTELTVTKRDGAGVDILGVSD